jgi:hypothetical protein
MMILMGRILAETEYKVLVEPYGTYEDWYDAPDEENRKWVRKDKIEAIDDAPVEPHEFTGYVNTEEALELSMSHAQAGRFL